MDTYCPLLWRPKVQAEALRGWEVPSRPRHAFGGSRRAPPGSPGLGAHLSSLCLCHVASLLLRSYQDVPLHLGHRIQMTLS